MRILTEVKDIEPYYGQLIFYVSFSLLMLIMLGILLFALAQSVDGQGIFLMVVCGILFVACSYATYGTFRDGPTIQYKATVTDFNQVYKNGYKIVSRDGDLYLLEKDDSFQ